MWLGEEAKMGPSYPFFFFFKCCAFLHQELFKKCLAKACPLLPHIPSLLQFSTKFTSHLASFHKKCLAKKFLGTRFPHIFCTHTDRIWHIDHTYPKMNNGQIVLIYFHFPKHICFILFVISFVSLYLYIL